MTNETGTQSAANDICISRRSVLTGASALALATAALRMRSVLAEDGTPVATPEDAPSWLFTQTFTSGDWERTDDPAKFTLHLRGGLASTVGFTDRPYRDFMMIPTPELLPKLWDDPTNPPNAAIIVEEAGTQYTFLLVLNDPVYDEAGDMVTYTVSVLSSYEGTGLGPAVERVADGTLPQSFRAGAIFIDSFLDCKDKYKACRQVKLLDCTRAVGHLEASVSANPTGTCRGTGGCQYPCGDGAVDKMDAWCDATFPDYCVYTDEVRGCSYGAFDINYALQSC